MSGDKYKERSMSRNEALGLAESLRDIRRMLVERLKTTEQRQDRHMVELIDFMERLDADPGEVLHAAVYILVAIDPEVTRDELIKLATGIGEVRRAEKAELAEEPLTRGMH